MITIKVFGPNPPCAKCMETEKRARKVAENYPGEVEVVKLDALSDEGAKYGVMITPTLVVNDKIVATGRVITEAELDKIIKKELGA